jgi:hypothetical protein
MREYPEKCDEQDKSDGARPKSAKSSQPKVVRDQKYKPTDGHREDEGEPEFDDLKLFHNEQTPLLSVCEDLTQFINTLV